MDTLFGYINAIDKQVSQSTNSELIRLITDEQLNNNQLHRLTARTQTAGRGQYNRTWVSPLGNVYLSLYVPIGEHFLHRLTGLLSPLVGLSLLDMPTIRAINHTLCQHNKPPIQVKWANDLGFFDKDLLFCKLSGILIEPVYKAKLVGVVVGVGMNVLNSPSIKDGLYRACCLKQLTSDFLDNTVLCNNSNTDILNIDTLYNQISQAIIHACQQHNDIHNPSIAHSFITNYNANHALHGQKIGIFEQNNTDTPTYTGICTSICQDGTLILDNHQVVFTGMARKI